MTIIRHFKMKIISILNSVHVLAIVLIYFTPGLKQDTKNVCFDEKHNESSMKYLPQVVVFGILILLTPKKEGILFKYYDYICFILTIISWCLLLIPSVNIYKYCEAGIADLFIYIPTCVTIFYVIGFLVTYLWYLCSCDRQQQEEETYDSIV